MTHMVETFARKALPKWMREKVGFANRLRLAVKPIAIRNCNICNFKGYFKAFGRPLRLDARCPNCGSLERHRLFMMALKSGSISAYESTDCKILHFAPEPIFEDIFRKRFKNYETADLFADADLKLDMENIALPDEQYDMVIANHVLEHVDDYKASREIARILKSNGVLVCQVPLIEGWETTYEDPSITDEARRQIHFGQRDHVRYYGSDFRDRISKGGLKLVREITAEGNDVVNHGLLRGDKVFVFQKMP